MADESKSPSVQMGFVLAYELLVAELHRKKSIDAPRLEKELDAAADSLGPENDQSEATVLLRLLALQIRYGLPNEP